MLVIFIVCYSVGGIVMKIIKKIAVAVLVSRSLLSTRPCG